MAEGQYFSINAKRSNLSPAFILAQWLFRSDYIELEKARKEHEEKIADEKKAEEMRNIKYDFALEY